MLNFFIPVEKGALLLYGCIIAACVALGALLQFGFGFNVLLWSLLIGVGLCLINHYADTLIQGTVGLSDVFSIPRMVVGIIVMGFGTSLPEMVTSILAATRNETALVVGNIAGSNIANTALVLGLGMAMATIHRTLRELRWDYLPVLIISGIFMVMVLWDATNTHGTYNGTTNVISRWEGIILAVTLVVYLTFTYIRGRRSPEIVLGGEFEEALETVSEEQPSRGKIVLITFVGLVGLVGGSYVLLEGAVEFARELHVSQLLIGLTILAVGTSLPELVSAIKAARAGEQDLIIGTILGSNLFNMLAVGGVSSLIAPLWVENDALSGLVVDLSVMTLLVLILLPFLLRGSLSRGFGLFLVAVYIAYLTFLVITAPSTA